MNRFWLATFDLEAAADDTDLGPIRDAGASYLAIEVFRDQDDWGVLFSSVDDPEQPTTMTCLVGFTNVAKACNVWLDRGFPLVDAAIEEEEAGVLTVVSPHFVRDQTSMRYDEQLLTLSGIDFGPPSPDSTSSSAGLSAVYREYSDATAGPEPPVIVNSIKEAGRAEESGKLVIPYEQYLQAPNGAQPDLLTDRIPVVWRATRQDVRRLWPSETSRVTFKIRSLSGRYPSLAPLKAGPMTPRAVWSGTVRFPDAPDTSLKELTRQSVSPTFGVAAFRFEDVEVLGFRVNLAELPLGPNFERDLAALIEPLNFHLSEKTTGWNKAIPDFRYRAATSTLIIELLRYGRMKARAPVPPLGVADSQSQHELVVRLLVGRVDDDTAQAHAPAVYAPAIFVDNPWSKVLGRDSIGYDKRMAHFCVDEGPLLPDGRLPRPGSSNANGDRGPEPLGNIRHINLVHKTGFPSDLPLLDLEFPSNDHTDPEALQPIDLDLTLGRSALAGTRWRQTDFDDAEFRRSFASAAVADSVRAFRSIQVAPVVGRGDLAKTWITGTFAVDDGVRVALPSGIATLTMHAIQPSKGLPVPSTPASWNLLCKMLGDGKVAKIPVVTGSWYRMLFSMDLTIDDGLDWGTLDS